MKTDGKLAEMLAGYSAAHQHPANVAIHIVCIPIIMLGVLIPLTRVTIDIDGFTFSLAEVVLLGFFFFYLTLDAFYAIVFVLLSYLLILLAYKLGAYPGNMGWYIAAACFFGGYTAQFVGHAIEKSMPVLTKHPIQANLSAPLFTVIEIFELLGLRDKQASVAQRGDTD